MSGADDLRAEAARNADQMRQLEHIAVERAQAWVTASAKVAPDAAATRLAGLLRDSRGLEFTVGFVDGVVRPEDSRVAARNLHALSRSAPTFLPWSQRVAVRIGGLVAPLLPWVVVPVARKVLRTMVRHLIIDARPRTLGSAIKHLTADADGAVRLNINLLGEAVLGKEEAHRRLAGTLALIKRDDVDYVSVKASAIVAPHTPWAFDHAVREAVEGLKPLYLAAASKKKSSTFINLDMEEYHDLELTLAVFMTLLEDPNLTHYRAGIVLQAYLPDAWGAMVRLQQWAARRVQAGGAPIKVRVVKGANLPMERVDADIHGWPLATWESKAHTDANYKALLGYALHPERIANVGIGVAGHNLFDIALAWELAQARGVHEDVDIEMLLGMAPQQVAAVRESVGNVLLYTPIVKPGEFDAAIAYLIRRLEEGASQDNFMSAAFDIHKADLFDRESARFRQSLQLIPTDMPTPRRVQDRQAEQRVVSSGGFQNEPDSDSSVPSNIAWADAIRSRMAGSTLGANTAAEGWVNSRERLDDVMRTAHAAGEEWGQRPVAQRAALLRKVAVSLAEHRAQFLEVMGSECGKVIEQGDPEVSEAIDFANYYALSAERLEDVEGARFEPLPVTVVTPPWNFPVAIPAGGVLAALAAGSAVVLKPAELAHRCSAVLVEALWEAGVPRELVQYVRVDEAALGRELICHDLSDQVILTGGYETAQLFRSFDSRLRLFAETSGKNAIIVTPSGDLDLAAKDVAASAFGHAGQKCSAASLVVLVGSVGKSAKFRRQLVDAASSMRVGLPQDGESQVGPVIEPPHGKLKQALTTLEKGHRWMLKPTQVNKAGTLWSPGIRDGVRGGDEFHLTEYFGPVLGIMEVDTLEDAIATVNRVDYGLTSGLHSLDRDEIAQWLATIEAGNLYVNRSITGAIVQRQPFGGWKRSMVGTGTKAGGPNYVAGLGGWADAPQAVAAGKKSRDPLTKAILKAADAAVDKTSRAWLRAALVTDERVHAEHYGAVVDASGLQYELNALRYQAVPVTIRAELEDGGNLPALVRVLAAALRVEAQVTLSIDGALPKRLLQLLASNDARVHVEHSAQWEQRAAALTADGGRIRLVGGDPAATLAATEGSPLVAVYANPVVAAGRIEMLPFLREQAVSVTAHRFGVRRDYEIPPLAPVRR